MRIRAASLILAFLFSILMASGQSPGTEALILSSRDIEYGKQRYQLEPYITVLVDSSGNLDIEDVSSERYASRFHPDTGHLLTSMGSDLRGGDIEYIWAKLSVRSELAEMLQWLININAEDVELDNTLIENKIRPLALGRKNYLFAGGDLGAEWAAMLPDRLNVVRAGTRSLEAARSTGSTRRIGWWIPSNGLAIQASRIWIS